MEAQFRHKAYLVIKNILIGIITISIFSCASSGGQEIIKKEEDTYKIIDIVLSGISTTDQVTNIYIDSCTINPLFVEELKNTLLVNEENKAFHFLNSFLSKEELQAIFSVDEINFMIDQLNTPFMIDLEKINKKNFFMYEKPANNEMPATSIYCFSRPVFTSDKQYSVLLIYKHHAGHWIEIYKKQKKDWKSHKKVMLGIE